jgi:acetylcholinesterase
MDELLMLYPQNVTKGSPYDTGTPNALTPEFKRIASILGDLTFQAPRRFLLQSLSDKQNAWSYCMLFLFQRSWPPPPLPSILTQ